MKSQTQLRDYVFKLLASTCTKSQKTIYHRQSRSCTEMLIHQMIPHDTPTVDQLLPIEELWGWKKRF